MFPVWFLDMPDVCVDNPNPEMFQVKGWIMAPDEIHNIRFKDKLIAQLIPITRTTRIDVLQAYPLPSTGFEASSRFILVKNRDYLEMEFQAGKKKYDIIIPVHSGQVNIKEQKARKLAKIRQHLICPQCGCQALSESSKHLTCPECKEAFPFSGKNYNFLTASLRQKFDIISTENVSANHYDGYALNMIHKHSKGLILDCGAGLREKYYENVVNYEIAPYDSTDVLGVGERLPFKDNTFDAVFSFAVLEHVKDPFVCARELIRVLKPDGEIYCNVPFLQPLHGYPHHYYNMTEKGLQNLFEDLITVERSETLNFGQPVFTLSWFLNSYLKGLPEKTKASFLDMKVRDLLKPGAAYIGSDFVTKLSEETKKELACCNLITGRKKS